HPAHAVPNDPQVLERRLTAHELLMKRAGTIRVLAAAEARIDDCVAQRLAPPAGVGCLLQAALVISPPLILIEITLHDEHRMLLGGHPESERLVVDHRPQRELPVECLPR